MKTSILTNAPLYYPAARTWMWDYCVYLGPFTSEDGHNYDIGVYIHADGSLSAAIVYGNEPGDYKSGSLDDISKESLSAFPEYAETIKRAKSINII